MAEEPEGQEREEGQEGAPPPAAPETPVEEVAQQYGYDPELFRSQYEEVKRREREVEKREREVEQRARERERQLRFPDPSLDMLDPVQRSIMERQDRIERILTEEREERQREREEQRDTERLTRELDTSYVNIARTMGFTKEQMDARAAEVFDTLVAIYPERSMIRAIGPDVAIRNAFRVVRSGNGHAGPTTTTTRLSPRTPIVTAQGTGPVEDRSDFGPQRQGESNTEYAQRVLRNYEASGVKGLGLRDGEKISSE